MQTSTNTGDHPRNSFKLEKATDIGPAVSLAEFEEYLENVETRTRSGTRNQSAQNHSDLETVLKYAAQQGLSNDNLRRCLDLAVLPTNLDQKSRQSIIKSLYPVGRVSPGVVHAVASSLGLGAQKPSLAIQQLLLKWLIMVYPVLESSRSVSRIYSAFFNLLDITGLRSYLVHYLALITLKKHVTPFRIHTLQSLLCTAPREIGLDKLCQIYEQYAPGHLDVPKPRNNINFAHPDIAWAARLQFIYNQCSGQRLAPGSFSMPFGFSVRINDQTTEENTSKYDMKDMDNPKDVATYLENIHNPVMVARDLQDPLIQQFFMLQSGGNNAPEINIFLDEICQQQLLGLADGDELDSEAFEMVLQFVRCCKVLPDKMADFFRQCLPHWDGNRDRSLTLDLLSYLPIRPFEELQSTHLRSLEAALLQNPPPTAQIRLLDFYTSLLRNWTAHLLAQSAPPTPDQQSTLAALSAHTAVLALRILVHPVTPTTGSAIPDPRTAVLSHLLSFLLLVQPPLSLELPPPPPLVIYTLLLSPPTLPTLNTTASLLARYKHAFDPASPNPTKTTSNRPSSHTQSLNTCLIDTCNLLFRTRAFNATDALASSCFLGVVPPFTLSSSSNPAPSSVSNNTSDMNDEQTSSRDLPPPQQTSSHNATRSALETYTSSLSLAPDLNSLAGLFGLSCHPALVGLSNAALRAAEEEQEGGEYDNVAAATATTTTSLKDKNGTNAEGRTKRLQHAGPVTPRSLADLARAGGLRLSWRQYRILVLRWLDAVGVTGVGELGQATMKTTLGIGDGRTGGGNGGAAAAAATT